MQAQIANTNTAVARTGKGDRGGQAGLHVWVLLARGYRVVVGFVLLCCVALQLVGVGAAGLSSPAALRSVHSAAGTRAVAAATLSTTSLGLTAPNTTDRTAG